MNLDYIEIKIIEALRQPNHRWPKDAYAWATDETIRVIEKVFAQLRKELH